MVRVAATKSVGIASTSITNGALSLALFALKLGLMLVAITTIQILWISLAMAS